MNLKAQIEFYLDDRGMNATELARRTQVPRQTLANWLMGQKPKDIEQVKLVANYFSVSLDHLLFGDKSIILHATEPHLLFRSELIGSFEVCIRKI